MNREIVFETREEKISLKKITILLICILAFQSTGILMIETYAEEANKLYREETYDLFANELDQINLLEGSDIGYETYRQPTRLEGVVMALRLMGKEEEANSYTGNHPFEDVPNWANNYVAYAYETGIVQGVNDKEFGSRIVLSFKQYITLLLRVLGYSEEEGDFSWETVIDKAIDIGLFNKGYADNYGERGYMFLRGDYIINTLKVLRCPPKESEITLGQQLYNMDAIDKEWSVLYNFADELPEEIYQEANITYIPLIEDSRGSRYIDYGYLMTAFPSIKYVEVDTTYSGQLAKQEILDINYLTFYFMNANMLYKNGESHVDKYRASAYNRRIYVEGFWGLDDYLGNIVFYDKDLKIIARYTSKELDVVDGKGVPFEITDYVDEEQLKSYAAELGLERIQNVQIISPDVLLHEVESDLYNEVVTYSLDEEQLESYGIVGYTVGRVRGEDRRVKIEPLSVFGFIWQSAVYGDIYHRMYNQMPNEGEIKDAKIQLENKPEYYESYVIIFYDKEGNVVVEIRLSVD